MDPIISAVNNNVVVVSPLVHEHCRLAMIGDYHCTLADSRDDEYKENYARVAQYCYHEMETLRKMIQKAGENSDAVLLAGDIISFPAFENVEALASVIQESPVPCLYIAGNHDWHFEGVPGSDREQRDLWISKRMLPLYNGRNPLGYSVTVKGIKIIMIDNSIYHILPEQLAFVEKELSDGIPALFCMHIPIYLPLPGRKESSVVDYGCGNPAWGAATDPYWEIEQRERWAEKQTPETAVFCRLLTESKNVLGIVAGHTHTFCVDTFNQRFQMVLGLGVPHELEVFPAG